MHLKALWRRAETRFLILFLIIPAASFDAIALQKAQGGTTGWI